MLHTSSEQLRTFPVMAAADNLFEQRSAMRLLDDGTIQGDMTLSTKGSVSSTIRDTFSGITPEEYPQIVERALQRRDEAGTGTLRVVPEFSDASGPDISAHWTSPKLISMDDDIVSMKLPNGFTPLPFTNLNDDITNEKRVTPEILGQSTVHKLITLIVPDGYKVLHLPKNVSYDDGNLGYAVVYKQEGQNIVADQ